MLFFKKKKVADLNREDLALIETNAKTVGVLVQETDDEGFRAQLTKLGEELRYLDTSVKPEVYDYDKKIERLLGDLKTALEKCRGEAADDKSLSLLKDISVTIAARKVAE